MFPKGLERGLEELYIGGQNETIQTTVLLRSARIRRSLQIDWAVGFYGISTIVGKLIPNPFYTYKQVYLKQFSFAYVRNLIIKSVFFTQFSLAQIFVYTHLHLKTVNFKQFISA